MLNGIQARYEGELAAYREANKDEAETTTATFFENECAMEIQIFSVVDGNDDDEMVCCLLCIAWHRIVLLFASCIQVG